MGIKWWERLAETAENKKARQLKELASTDDFKTLVVESAAELIRNQKRQERELTVKLAQDHQDKLEKAIDYIDTIGTEMEDSNEPFCNVLSMGFDPTQGVKVKLDWNDAFIRYLNAAGIKAANDDETIRMWLAHLNHDIDQEALASDYLMNGVGDDELPEMGYDELFDVGGKDDPPGVEPENEWPPE